VTVSASACRADIDDDGCSGLFWSASRLASLLRRVLSFLFLCLSLFQNRCAPSVQAQGHAFGRHAFNPKAERPGEKPGLSNWLDYLVLVFLPLWRLTEESP